MSSRCFSRVILIVLDGVGVGALPDAEIFGDAGSNTLLHVAEATDGLELPHLQQFGLGNICPAPGLAPHDQPRAGFGKMVERSVGKDTTTGHWELAGLLTTEPFTAYPDGFPADIIEPFEAAIGTSILGNIAASGTDIIDVLGSEHLQTARPIVYTSSDSVFQIAAHEDVIPLEKLYDICRVARQLLDPYRVGRVIARPFIGTPSAGFTRTHRRHDYSMPPPAPTLLDLLSGSGVAVTGVGKISDIFAGKGVTHSVPTRDNTDGMAQISTLLKSEKQGLIFANLVDFDMLYGHRLDAEGFADALTRFDQWMPELQHLMQDGDLLLLTADHGCDPLTTGTDHTREYVPLLAWHRRLHQGVDLGVRASFADVAATVAAAFKLRWPLGESFLGRL